VLAYALMCTIYLLILFEMFDQRKLALLMYACFA
jgi:hypothetical protein